DSLNRDRDRHLVLERMIADASAPDDKPAAAAPARAVDSGETVAGGLTASATGTSTATPAPTASQQLDTTRAALNVALTRLTPEHPDVIRLRKAAADLERRVAVEAATAPTPRPSPADAARQRRLDDATTELQILNRQVASKTGEEARLRGVLADYQRRIEVT